MGTEVLSAWTREGLRLPVLDITNAAFAVNATEAELAVMAEQYRIESASRGAPSTALLEALRGSDFGRAIQEGAGSFLPDLITYRMKLGPDQQRAEAHAETGSAALVHPIDLRIAASFPSFAMRLRLRDMARLLAGGVEAPLSAGPGRPLCLFNIGGGTAVDSWNALICLRARRSGLLESRDNRIVVLDVSGDGALFGVGAVEALQAPGAPLGGLAVGLRHISYDWSRAELLREILAGLHASEKVCAISSEGALFEYGTDEEIVANLQAIHAETGPETRVVGSVTRDCDMVRASLGSTRFAVRPRTMEAFTALANAGGWALETVIERPFCWDVRMRKALPS